MRDSFKIGYTIENANKNEIVKKDIHSASSMAYTNGVVKRINKYEWNDFSRYCLHLSFEETLENFYLCGWEGDGFLDHVFKSKNEEKELEQFYIFKRLRNYTDENNDGLHPLLFNLYKNTVGKNKEKCFIKPSFKIPW